MKNLMSVENRLCSLLRNSIRKVMVIFS